MAGSYQGFPLALRDCTIDNIRIGNQIGRGANGRILEAKWEGNDEPKRGVVAVNARLIHSIFMNEVSDREFQSFKTSFLRECEQSSRLRHPNIVCFFGIYHPLGARVPSLVMERLHCSLTSLLEENPVVSIGTKLSIIKDVALGLRYLHTRNPPIIHRDLSSNNVLLSKGMEGKIGDLGTTRLVDPRRQSRMTKAPGTVDFMPPEALEDVTNIRYGRELDVFSFGCVMLHTLSHQWPTPSQAVVINPETDLITGLGGRTEVERRSKYFERIDRSRSDALIPLIENCLNNLPKNRPAIVRVCDQLEGQLVDRETVLTDELIVSALQQELRQKDAEIQRKDGEIQSRDTEIQQKNNEIQHLTITLDDKDSEIQRNYNEIQRKDAEAQRRDTEIQRKDGEIHSKDIEIQRKNTEIQHLTTTLHYKDSEIQRNYNEIQRKDAEAQRRDTEIQRKDGEIQRKNTEIQHLTTALHDKDVTLETLRADMSKLQITTSHPLPNKVSIQCVVIHYHYVCDVSGQ